jgi:hypothetical protein
MAANIFGKGVSNLSAGIVGAAAAAAIARTV